MGKRKPGQLPRMILDKKMCLRIAEGDEEWARPSEPYHCPQCRKFSGKLRFEGKPVPMCEDHEPAVAMVSRGT